MHIENQPLFPHHLDRRTGTGTDSERRAGNRNRTGKKIGEKIGREKVLKQVALERRNTEKTLQEEKESGIQSIIVLCEEFGSSKDIIVEKLMEQCHLTKEQAQEKVELYWKKD